jgi:hypothetical protein
MRETAQRFIDAVKNFFTGLRDFFKGEASAEASRLGTEAELAPKKMFDSLSNWAPGLKDFKQEASAELSRLGTQGQMELASALFNGNAFVPYGPGQYTPTPEAAKDHGIGRAADLTGGHVWGHTSEQQHDLSRER